MKFRLLVRQPNQLTAAIRSPVAAKGDEDERSLAPAQTKDIAGKVPAGCLRTVRAVLLSGIVRHCLRLAPPGRGAPTEVGPHRPPAGSPIEGSPYRDARGIGRGNHHPIAWRTVMGSLIKKRRKRMRKKKHKKMLKATRWQRRAGK
ncbi:MAG: hypothetical protein NVSMB16_11930 [Acidimicrobiales bacterium]